MAKNPGNSTIVGSDKQSSNLPKRSWALLLLAVVLLGLVGIGYTQMRRKQQILHKLCVSEPTTALFPPVNNLNLQPMVDDIKEYKGHEKNATCMGVIVTYYISVGDPDNAQKYLPDLEKVYAQGYAKEIAPLLKNPEQAKTAIDFLNKQKEQVKKNSIKGPEVPAQ